MGMKTSIVDDRCMEAQEHCMMKYYQEMHLEGYPNENTKEKNQ